MKEEAERDLDALAKTVKYIIIYHQNGLQFNLKPHEIILADPAYEEPKNPELILDTERYNTQECLKMIIKKLEEIDYLK